VAKGSNPFRPAYSSKKAREEKTIAATPSKKHYDILGHKLVPDHMILSEKERKELLTRFKIRAEQLPRIQVNDPAAVAVDAKPGNILKVKRKSPTAKYTTAYRLVVESEASESSIFTEPSEDFSISSEEM
jgi:DNA-directed RNA polymerase subunit H